jgi:hypothetical protein
MQKCGECTACCQWLQLNEIPSAIGELCRHCTWGVGCKIYESRPQECKDYQCMWSQMDNVSIDLRPDNLGIIFDRAGDDVISARLSEDMEISSLIENQIANFMQEGFSVVVFHGVKKLGYLQKHHNREYVYEVIRGRAELH